MSSRLTIIRHAETAGNGGEDRPMSGMADLALTPNGRDQAARLERRLRDANCSASAIYSSPLRRALDTARPLLALARGRLIVSEELEEIDCGEVDGLPISLVRDRYPELWARNLGQEDPEFRWPGGESYRELRARCLAAVRAIAAAHPGERVLVVTHAGVISQVLGHIHGLSPAKWECFRPQNTSITEIEWTGSEGRLLSFDDHAHLAG